MAGVRETWIRRLLKWRYFFVINLCIALFLALSLGREVVRHNSIQEEIELMQAQVDDLATDNLEMRRLQSALQSESYIEREARLKLGMQLPGETLVVVQEGVATRVVPGGDASDPLDFIIDENDQFIQVTNRTKWWYYFFNKPAFEIMKTYE